MAGTLRKPPTSTFKSDMMIHTSPVQKKLSQVFTAKNSMLFTSTKRSELEDDDTTVYSDPLAEVVGDPRNITEIYLNEKKVEALRDFDKLPNLEVLWLNDNKLDRIRNLDSNFRLQHLYLARNKIVSLKGLKSQKFMRTLILSNNMIKDIRKSIHLLTHMNKLEVLDLSNNPVAEELDYRLFVLYHLPSLKVFDLHAVTDEEREEARVKFYGKDVVKIAFMQKIPLFEREKAPPIGSRSELAKDLKDECKKIRRRQEKRADDEFKAQFHEADEQRKALEEKAKSIPLPSSIDFLAKRREELVEAARAPPPQKMKFRDVLQTYQYDYPDTDVSHLSVNKDEEREMLDTLPKNAELIELDHNLWNSFLETQSKSKQSRVQRKFIPTVYENPHDSKMLRWKYDWTVGSEPIDHPSTKKLRALQLGSYRPSMVSVLDATHTFSPAWTQTEETQEAEEK